MLGLALGLFYSILNSPPLARDVTYSRLYSDRKKYVEAMSDEHPHMHGEVVANSLFTFSSYANKTGSLQNEH